MSEQRWGVKITDVKGNRVRARFESGALFSTAARSSALLEASEYSEASVARVVKLARKKKRERRVFEGKVTSGVVWYRVGNAPHVEAPDGTPVKVIVTWVKP